MLVRRAGVWLMFRTLTALLTLVLLALPAAAAQRSEPPAGEDKGTFLGVLFSAVPEIVYDQLPDLPPECGVAVTHVLPDSPAAQAKLRRHDILLQYNAEKIRDCEHFALLIKSSKPGQKVKLVLMRGGKETTAEVTLALGPVLKIAQAARSTQNEVPRAFAKSNGPASVGVSAQPLGGGNMKVTIEYYQEGTGRLRTLTCSGTPAEIDSEVQKLPPRVQNLARVAIERIRALDFQKGATTKPAAAPNHR